VSFLLLSASAAGAVEARDGDTGPAERVFLELEDRYSLAGFGVDLDIALAPGGAVTIGSASQGRLWRLRQGQLQVFADGRRCTRGAQVWPSRIAGADKGRLWVIDERAGRVQLLDAAGRSIACRSLSEARVDAAQKDSGRRDDAGDDRQWVLGTDQAGPRARRVPRLARACIEAGGPGRPDLPDLYCISRQADRILRVNAGRMSAEFVLPGRYPRVGGLAQDRDAGVFLTDAANARLYRLSPSLREAYRLRLYEKLLRSPGRLALADGRLWLIDEGRQELLRFALRRARTALEHRLLGEEFLSLGLYRQALAELARVAGVDPETALLRGRALYGLKRYQTALPLFSQAGREPRLRAEAGFRAANSLFRLGRLEAALGAYQRAAQGRGEYARPAAGNYAWTLLALGRYGAAADAFRDLMRRRPRDPGLRVGAARAALGQGDADAAITLLTPLPSASSPSAVLREARLTLGLARLAAGSAQQALPLLRQAAREGPHFREALTALAQAQRRLGRHQQALQTRATLASLPQRSAALNAFIMEE